MWRQCAPATSTNYHRYKSALESGRLRFQPHLLAGLREGNRTQGDSAPHRMMHISAFTASQFPGSPMMVYWSRHQSIDRVTGTSERVTTCADSDMILDNRLVDEKAVDDGAAHGRFEKNATLCGVLASQPPVSPHCK
ncbi:hypothetical protein DL98DRAFT_315294 [Cadophora sp. DSE1049]|nr:hypothetical protein DL98DRAFT_315294 [Cadophora sp. DSE1049]